MATVTVTKPSPKRPDRPLDARGRIALRASIVAAAVLAGLGVWFASSNTSAHELDRARGLIRQNRSPTEPEVTNLVQGALRRDLTQPAALEMRALAYERSGDRAAASRLYRLSDRISRRSLATRLWLVQDAVGRGDVRQALANMDVALRTSSAAPNFVFPALARGLEDPALVKPIAAMVDRPSDWREAFLIYASDSAEPTSAAALFLALRNARVISKDELDLKLIARLVDGGKFTLARRLDATFEPRAASGELVEDGSFDNSAARYPFGWGLAENGELGATREIEDGRAVLAYHANPAEGGQVAAQLLMLRPGSYELDLKAGRSQATQVPPVWTLACAGQAKTIATVPLTPGRRARQVVGFTVARDCPAQWLTLTVRPALVPQAGSIERVTISVK